MKRSSRFANSILLITVCTAPLTVRGALFQDNFDTYVAGSQMHGQGGWKGWDNTPGAGALADNAFSFSASNSVNINGGSDLVQTFTGATSGQWVFRAMQYVPSSSAGDSFIILLNTYNDGGPYNWSIQTHMNLGTNVVTADYGGGTLPLLKDQWVEYRAEINLDANSVTEFYNNQPLGTHTWTSDGNSVLAIAAVDLFANGAGAVYYDNVSLVPEPSSALLSAVTAIAGLCLVRNRKGMPS